MIELLSPVGDFESLMAAVQNGADAVYLGASSFSARAYASNFDIEKLKKAIEYAKIRGVKVHLALNTLIKNNEFKESFELAKKAYEFGIDAIIVQDLGLAKLLIKSFPDLDIHASTQLSVHNLQGVLELESLGFKRAVLSRELSIHEIEYICQNSNIEIECFVHGALCISYSGQCLFSSMLGGRSGNRGKCAQPCRLPYKLLENDNEIDSGYLLSTKDLCGLEFIPNLIKCGVTSLKIEGRMKSPQYVATVTRIYKKYINLATKNKTFNISQDDKKDLMQVFNRGNFSCGHLSNDSNKELIYKQKPNNMGLFLGIVQKYNKNKYITVKLNEQLSIGDSISLEKESGSYNVSELMQNNQNIKSQEPGNTVVIGRMKGNISLGDKIYKMSSKSLNQSSKQSYSIESRKIFLNCEVTIKKFQNIYIRITSASDIGLYKDLDITYFLNAIAIEAENKPLTKEKVIDQISKTSSTPFEFKKIKVDLDENAFLQKISSLNELRRNSLNQVEDFAIRNINRVIKESDTSKIDTNIVSTNKKFSFLDNIIKNEHKDFFVSVLLNKLNLQYDYSKLENYDNVYIPLKYFSSKKYENILADLSKNHNIYIYLPTILKSNYRNLFYEYINRSIVKYDIKGFVLSNISHLLLLDKLDNSDSFEYIANYTFNAFNNYTICELKNLNFSRFTLSPELDKKSLVDLSNNIILDKELIVYGKTPLMNMNYCVLGKSNRCYPDCSTKCVKEDATSNTRYYLKDRLGMKFLLAPDNIQTVTTIYNSKTTSISPNDFNTEVVRVDILDEDINQINQIYKIVKSGKRLEGKDYTNGNLTRVI